MASNKSTLDKTSTQTVTNTPATATVIEALWKDRCKSVSVHDHTGIPNIDLSAIKFAQPKAIKGKSTRPFCDHVYSDGSRCKLRVTDGGEGKCVNHVPAETRITEQEAIALSVWLEGLTAADRLVAYVRAAGWYAAKEQAKELQTVKQ